MNEHNVLLKKRRRYILVFEVNDKKTPIDEPGQRESLGCEAEDTHINYWKQKIDRFLYTSQPTDRFIYYIKNT